METRKHRWGKRRRKKRARVKKTRPERAKRLLGTRTEHNPARNSYGKGGWYPDKCNCEATIGVLEGTEAICLADLSRYFLLRQYSGS